MEPAASLRPTSSAELWESSPCPQLVLDPSAGTVLDADRTFWEWAGLEPSQVRGTAFARLLPVGDRVLWATHCLPRIEASGRVEEVSVEVVGAGGVRRAAFLSASRAGAGREPDRVLVALFGAAERRRYEEDLLAATRRAEASEARRAGAEARLQHLAHHDPVTGLLDRRGLEAALLEVLSGAGSASAPALRAVSPAGRPVVFSIDLDGFKQVNDSVGHAGGDVLLVTVAERLRAVVRSGAVLARFAGDEFVVVDVLPAGEGDALVGEVCRRLLAVLAGPVVISGVELSGGRTTGVEALVRWQHPERGLLPPSAFTGLAEASGLVRELGAWVLEAAVAQAAAWNAAGRRLEVSVNVSARQLADPDLPSTVLTALARHGVPASQLVLEITETALVLDPDAAATTLHRLVALGAKVAVDDFGTGCASLTYLWRFPVHELEVDRSFVDGVARDAGDRAIVAGCVQLAQGYLVGRPVPAPALER